MNTIGWFEIKSKKGKRFDPNKHSDDKAAYIVKAIRENWQFPEEYLREKREEQQKEEEGKIEFTKIKLQDEENKKRREEIKRIEQIYSSLDPL